MDPVAIAAAIAALTNGINFLRTVIRSGEATPEQIAEARSHKAAAEEHWGKLLPKSE